MLPSRSSCPKASSSPVRDKATSGVAEFVRVFEAAYGRSSGGCSRRARRRRAAERSCRRGATSIASAATPRPSGSTGSPSTRRFSEPGEAARHAAARRRTGLDSEVEVAASGWPLPRRSQRARARGLPTERLEAQLDSARLVLRDMEGWSNRGRAPSITVAAAAGSGACSSATSSAGRATSAERVGRPSLTRPDRRQGARGSIGFDFASGPIAGHEFEARRRDSGDSRGARAAAIYPADSGGDRGRPYTADFT